MSQLPQHRALGLVSKAIRDGVLKRMPCVICGAPKTHGHHTDYFKPLDVVWLCPKHHALEHVRLKKIGVKLRGKDYRYRVVLLKLPLSVVARAKYNATMAGKSLENYLTEILVNALAKEKSK